MALDYYDIEQNTEEWYGLRAGKATMSKLNCIMANYPRAFGEPAKKYAANIALEQLRGWPVSSGYTSEAMDKGSELEPLGRMEYEERFFASVTNGGFFCDDFVGASPDGLVGENGLIEIKSAIEAHVHFNRIRKKDIDSAYRWQCIGNIKFTGREWLDFVSYCPDFPDDSRLFVKRVYAKDMDREFIMIDERMSEFRVLVDAYKQTIETGDYFII